jgi:hypothetical protein
LRTSVATTRNRAVLAGARRLDRGVERQQVRLVGDLLDDRHLFRDVAHRDDGVLDRAAALVGLVRALGGELLRLPAVLAFCVIDADICSRLDVVSSTDAACSLVPCDSVCDVAETCAAAELSPAAPMRISLIV